MKDANGGSLHFEKINFMVYQIVVVVVVPKIAISLVIRFHKMAFNPRVP